MVLALLVNLHCEDGKADECPCQNGHEKIEDCRVNWGKVVEPASFVSCVSRCVFGTAGL